MANLVVSSGVTSTGLTINTGDTLEVLSGGTAIDITRSGLGVVTIDAGGVLSGGLVTSAINYDGTIYNSGGTLYGTTLSGEPISLKEPLHKFPIPLSI